MRGILSSISHRHYLRTLSKFSRLGPYSAKQEQPFQSPLWPVVLSSEILYGTEAHTLESRSLCAHCAMLIAQAQKRIMLELRDQHFTYIYI